MDSSDLDFSRRVLSPIIHLPQLNSPKRSPSKRRWEFHRTLTCPLQKEATCFRSRRETVTDIRAYPQLRLGIDCQRPTIHRLLRRDLITNLKRPASGMRHISLKGRGERLPMVKLDGTSTESLPRRDSVRSSIVRRGSVDRLCERGTILRKRVSL
jgi:hypothetical protein